MPTTIRTDIAPLEPNLDATHFMDANNPQIVYVKIELPEVYYVNMATGSVITSTDASGIVPIEITEMRIRGQQL